MSKRNSSHDSRGRPYQVSMKNKARGAALRSFIYGNFKNLTDFADHMGLSKQFVSNMASGRERVPATLLGRMIIQFRSGVPIKEIRPDLSVENK